jgi:hypothetical protein
LFVLSNQAVCLQPYQRTREEFFYDYFGWEIFKKKPKAEETTVAHPKQ